MISRWVSPAIRKSGQQRNLTDMTPPVDDRIFGLSPRARRFVVPFLAFAALVIGIGYATTERSKESSGAGPVVGGDLHAVGELGGRVFVGGHGGAGFRAPRGGWTQIDSLDDKDIMGWATTGSMLLAGGHEGLYASTDDSDEFDKVADVPVSDVHALGASGNVVYLASPESGVLVSTDAGRSFQPRSQAGRAFMGNIWVDPTNPDTAIAPSMQDGAVKTTDGGTTWSPLGSAVGSMAVAVDQTGAHLLALSMNGAEMSMDGGATWTSADVPDDTSAAAYNAAGNLVVATLADDRAKVHEKVGTKWSPLA